MDGYMLKFVFILFGIGHIDTGLLQRLIPDTHLNLTFEWEEPGQNLTEADYYSQVLEYSESYVNAAGGRPGHSTSTHSCNYIRGVPGSLRSASNIRPNGLSYFYQQYTEAYGIPVLASRYVPADALRRACYVLRFLLADHAHVRQSYYRLSGRVAVIGAREGTVSIPEHAWLGSGWNARARGLGATEHAPVSTGGEENILCYNNDRYRNEDIFLHEFSHGIHLLGAKHAIRGWERRLQRLYQLSRMSGRWHRTYAMSTKEEYFAEGTQSYFNVNAFSAFPNGVHNHVDTREKLRSYDPELFQLIEEVFPCGNSYIKRCATSRGRELNQQLRMDCQPGGSGTVRTTRPPITPTSTNRPITSTTVTVTQPTSQPITNAATTNPPITESPVTKPPVTGGCRDMSGMCSTWASRGECTVNPAYMHLNCRRSCQLCGSRCVDTGGHCGYWSQTGECTRNPAYMNTACMRSCGLC